MIRNIIAASLLPLFALPGCLAPRAGKVWVHPQILDFNLIKYQVFPFEDRVRSKKPLLSEDSESITRAVEASLDQAGVTVLPRDKLDALVESRGLKMIDVTEEQGLELAKELGADVAVYGLLTAFSEGECAKGETAVGFVLKGVKTDGWTDLFRGGIERRSAEPDQCTAEVLAKRAATDMVAKLAEGGIGPRNEL